MVFLFLPGSTCRLSTRLICRPPTYLAGIRHRGIQMSSLWCTKYIPMIPYSSPVNTHPPNTQTTPATICCNCAAGPAQKAFSRGAPQFGGGEGHGTRGSGIRTAAYVREKCPDQQENVSCASPQPLQSLARNGSSLQHAANLHVAS